MEAIADAEQGRDRLVAFMRRELVGPVGGPDEELGDEPGSKRYTMGVLFPQEAKAGAVLEDEEEDDLSDGATDQLADDPVTLAGQLMPSSMGLSFFFTGEGIIEAAVHAARYERLGGRPWRRIPVAEEEEPEIVSLRVPERLPALTKTDVLEGRAFVGTRWRKLGSGYLVTVTLVNTAERDEGKVDPADCLCQVGFTCRVPGGEIREYPSVRLVTADEEERELQLLYRKHKVFAVGHGCAAFWEVETAGPAFVRTEVMPRAVVPTVTHDMDESPDVLRIARLADEAVSKDTIIGELLGFTDFYEGWIQALPAQNDDVPAHLGPAAERVLARLRETLARMRKGVRYLERTETAWKAFRWANLAMLMQMRRAGRDLAGKRRLRDEAPEPEEDYLGLPYKWRPFQLAFQLLTVESAAEETSEDRETVDLIWFPTGGGKTEAYLTLAAFEIFHRRLVHGEAGGGTAVMTRYTLRLLTAQQFQRAARLICACEILRREHEDELGRLPISIGFWAGMSASPNTFEEARDKFVQVLEDPEPAERNPFQIEQCPWCGTELLPRVHKEDAAYFGFRCDNATFEVFCPTEACPFHDRLPISVVDEDLYRTPPSFLIATVDKFARLAWVEGGGAFFGGNGIYQAPTLVIQDELHLLSGPLGTTVGLYESAFDALMAYHGAKPKIVASTATIRSAGEQVRGLFGRAVSLFPPPGLSAEDSFFARVDHSKPGRLYVGILSSNHRSATSEVRAAAALQQGVVEADLDGEERDAYWTLVIYHLSLRELGKTVSFARDDIPARIKVIARAEDVARELLDDDVLELTSNLNAAEIPASLSRLDRPFSDPEAVSVLACTNMFSVGVDVPRLGLMMVCGQPKTTSEYIQASSRVGRGKTAGLVVTHYSATKPRDRSHYESFLPYHAALYRHVEPTSVTPFSLPSRNRALHAALVILVRHGVGLSANTDARDFDPSDAAIQRAIDMILDQAGRKDPSELENTRLELDALVAEWHRTARDTDYPLCYKADRPLQTLLKSFGEEGDGWPTLHSMRSVDAQCDIKVLGETA